jgi:hypothetical protein
LLEQTARQEIRTPRDSRIIKALTNAPAIRPSTSGANQGRFYKRLTNSSQSPEAALDCVALHCSAVIVAPQNRLSSRRHALPLIASVLCGLAVLVAASLPRRPAILPRFSRTADSARPTSPPVAPNLAFVPTFRLGSAAQPFGWSTAVGDFNTDGTPDLVIADHTARRAGLYAYQIQFSVSGLDARNFAFESAQDSISVRVSDVDHDDDLDVVVNSAASRELVGIWLNDGHGRFKSADLRQFTSEIRWLRSVSVASDRTVDPVAGPLRDRRSTDGLVAIVREIRAWSRPRLVALAATVLPSLQSPADAPRGPPPSLT